jgi:peptidoglycan hydrolase-like protein with peptidoglycan-binding domain
MTSSYPRRTVLRAMAIGSAAVLSGVSTAGVAFGVSAPDVRELQIRVAGWAADDAQQTFLAVNGILDAATEAAMRRFQHAYGLPPGFDATWEKLAALTKPDGSTAGFEWAQFGEVSEPTRRLMYKLEALRHKAGGRKITVLSGLHRDGSHAGNGAADITVAGLTTYAVHRIAQTCGFSGLGPWTRSWLHCDSRAEYAANAAWSWAGGTVG